jgi:hypothetical protein
MTVFAFPIVLFLFLLPVVGAALVVIAVFQPAPQLAASCVRSP